MGRVDLLLNSLSPVYRVGGGGGRRRRGGEGEAQLTLSNKLFDAKERERERERERVCRRFCRDAQERPTKGRRRFLALISPAILPRLYL